MASAFSGPTSADAEDLEVLEALDAEIDRHVRAARESDPKLWISLVRLRMDLRAELARLRPTPPIGPDDDPLSLAAQTMGLAKVAKAVAANATAINRTEPNRKRAEHEAEE